MLPVAVPETSAARSIPLKGATPEEGLAVRVTERVGVGVGVGVGDEIIVSGGIGEVFKLAKLSAEKIKEEIA